MAAMTNLKGRGVSLRYLDTRGSGFPVLLLHGVMGRGSCWQRIMEDLAPVFRCIALDQRGHGGSGKPDAGYAREDYVADLECVADQLGLARFAMIGHSTGALNAWVYAAKHPERVAALVLEDMNASPKGLAYQEGWRQWLEEWPVPFRSREEVHGYFAKLRPSLGDYFAQLFEEQADGWRPIFRKDTVLQTIAGNEARPWWDELSRIACPSLVIKGGNSNFPLEEALRMAEVLPQGRLQVIEGASHTVHADQPQVYVDAVRSFLLESLAGEIP